MFDSKLLKFVASLDLALIKRVSDLENVSIILNKNDLDKALKQRYELFDLLELKITALNGISRNMMAVASSDESYASEQDNLNLWYLVSNELSAINDLQRIVFALDRAIFNTLEVPNE